MVDSSQSEGPIWLNEGAYAKYALSPSRIGFLNNTFPFAKNESEVIYTWRCGDLNDIMAKLEISLECETKNTTVNLSTIVYANILTNNIYFLNGTLIGRTWVWLLPYPIANEKIVLLNTPPNTLTGYVEGAAANSPRYQDTPNQGVQKIFSLKGNGTLDSHNIIYFDVSYDFNTGILLAGYPTTYEPTFLALGVKSTILTQVNLVDTNIDLGPAELSFTINAAIPYVAVIAAFSLITIGLCFANKQKKKKMHSIKRR